MATGRLTSASPLLLCIFCALPSTVLARGLRGGCTSEGMQPDDVPEVLEFALINYDQAFSAQNICSCVPSKAFDRFAAQSKSALMTMVKKTPESMRLGLEEFGQATAALAEHAEQTCTKDTETFGILKIIARKLQPSSYPEEDFHYEQLESLVLGGRNIHNEMNEFLLSFFSRAKADKIGLALANVFDALMEDDQDSDQATGRTDNEFNGQRIDA